MIWDIIEAKLSAANLATPGVNLFRQTLPAALNNGIMLRAPLEGIHVDMYLPGYYKPQLQVIVRHTDPVAGGLLAKKIQKALTTTNVERYPPTADRGQVQISLFYPRTLPIEYPLLDGKTREWSLNFNTAFTLAELP